MIRIMQLDYQIKEQKIIVKQGITLTRPWYKKILGFGKISSMYTPYPEDLLVEKIYGFDVKDERDGFKDVVINPFRRELEIEEDEDSILLIIEWEYIERERFTGKRIAGRYPEEGIFLLKPGEKIAFNRDTIREFVAVQIEGKMYLVELYTE